MIEAYAFLGMFTVQILTVSVLYSTWFTKTFRAKLRSEWFAELYPDPDARYAHERFLAHYRALNAGIAALGVLLLGWFFSDAAHSEWNVPSVKALAAGYS